MIESGKNIDKLERVLRAYETRKPDQQTNTKIQNLTRISNCEAILKLCARHGKYL